MNCSSKYLSLLIISLILGGALAGTRVSAGSAEGDPAPPSGNPGGNGGGGGGGPDIFYYFIPLVFNESHRDGESKVVVWTFQPTIIQTSFSINEAGLNSIRLDAPGKVEFSPSTSPGLTNGSLIITVGPAQVVGMRDNQDIYSDISFSYSILPARMMGYEYISPFDGYLSAFTRSQSTELRTSDGRFVVVDPFTTVTIPVKSGEYINSTQPILGAFYSQDGTGTSTTMAVPFFLQGKEYIFKTDISANRAEEIDLSYIKVVPEVPTELNITYVNGTVREITVFGETSLKASENIRGISALRGRITVSLEKIVSYSYISRRSTIELIAAPEMRAGELFSLFDGFSTSWSVLNRNTNTTIIDFTQGGYALSQREAGLYDKFEDITYGKIFDRKFILANNSLFGIASSPGYSGYPMSPSMSFIPLPMNTQTIYRNVTGVQATWYRFTNLSIKSIEYLPADPERFTGEKIRVTFISNGSLPAGNFDLQISINGEIIVDESYPFLQVNDTIVYEFDQFLQLDDVELTVLAKIDTGDTVSEINEDDNELSKTAPVEENLRIIVTLYLIVFLILYFVVYKIYKNWKRRKKIEESKFDAILEIQEETDNE